LRETLILFEDKNQIFPYGIAIRKSDMIMMRQEEAWPEAGWGVISGAP
jgi:hypothetical protein